MTPCERLMELLAAASLPALAVWPMRDDEPTFHGVLAVRRPGGGRFGVAVPTTATADELTRIGLLVRDAEL